MRPARLLARAVHTFPFVGAAVALFVWGTGLLRLPGIAAGALAAALAVCGRSLPAACLGAAAAPASFGAQVMQGFCPDCTAAALLFALGALLCGPVGERKTSLVFLAILGAASLVLGAAWAAGATREEALPVFEEHPMIGGEQSLSEERAAAQLAAR